MDFAVKKIFKKTRVFFILILVIGILLCLLYRKHIDYENLEKLTSEIIDEEISNLQFKSEYIFDNEVVYGEFLDSWNECYDILRISNLKNDCESNKKGFEFVYHFIRTTLPIRLNLAQGDPCSIIADIKCDSVFQLPCRDKVIKIKEILTPYWFSRRYLFMDYDIWE